MTQSANDALAEGIVDVRQRIAAAAKRSGRLPEDILLVAVTKTVSVERMLAAAARGLTTFGENRVQEARDKREALMALSRQDETVAQLVASVRWELIGHLQSNKVSRALELFDRVQSVDSVHLAQALSARAAAAGFVLPVLLEVNIGGEASKAGFAPEDMVEAAHAILALPALQVQGLMTVAPMVSAPEQARPFFQRLRELRDFLREVAPVGADGGWQELSMGMTDDFEVAIEESATIVRVGRGIFGSRPAPRLVEPTTR